MFGEKTTQPDPAAPGNARWWQKAATLNGRLYIVYAAGIAASFSALFQMAVKYAGWPELFGPTLPIVVDVYWVTALQIALDSSRSTTQRWKAGIHAFFAISLSITGNIMYHLLDTGIWHLDVRAHGVLVALIACVPVVLTGTLTHLVLLARPAGNRGAGTEPAVPGLPVPDSALVAPVPVLAAEPLRVVPEPVPGTGAEPLTVPSQSVPGTTEPAEGTGTTAEPSTESAGSRSVTPAGTVKGVSQHAAPGAAARGSQPRPAGLCEAVTLELASRTPPPRPMEEATQLVARAAALEAEFKEKTGVRMNNGELGRAMHIHKARVKEIRDAIPALEGEGQQPDREEGTA